MTAVFVAVIGGVFGLATIWLQSKVHRDNRSDHAKTSQTIASTSAKIDQLLAAQGDIAADVRDVKSDVRDHGVRLRALEAVTKPATPRPRKKAV
jgi:hypothetical protein